ncbi:adenine deaminase [Arenicella chitinivorans]|uniref:Adenine deaminase n=1 Tax=Arenicella chitinivorans TaxID=1329800 RepID=A0A918RIE3_9GAMM|nr:adenosine deaminase [Arenicella chitinivorans]GGZ97460.1 adenine deaminase [Arenicella chitinivorans]
MLDQYAEWLATIPKTELHLHLDGSLQAHRMLSLAAKHGIGLPYASVGEVEAAYQFKNLQSFLDLYYLGASVLRDEEDFYHLMMDYLLVCREQNIVHCEIMIEPQTYAPNGVSFSTMMAGFTRAVDEAEHDWGQSVGLILSLLRHLSEEDALQTLTAADEFRDQFVAIGLASAELGNPPEKFVRLYAAARERGYRLVAHAGEEGPADYIWQALKRLQVDRIDHGVRCVDDPELMAHLAETRIPLTVCPLSNVRLRVFERMADHTLLQLLEKGLCVTVNSDDPAYFGGYLSENYHAMHVALGLDRSQTLALIRNGFEASFLSDQKKQMYLVQLAN